MIIIIINIIITITEHDIITVCLFIDCLLIISRSTINIVEAGFSTMVLKQQGSTGFLKGVNEVRSKTNEEQPSKVENYQPGPVAWNLSRCKYWKCECTSCVGNMNVNILSSVTWNLRLVLLCLVTEQKGHKGWEWLDLEFPTYKMGTNHLNSWKELEKVNKRSPKKNICVCHHISIRMTCWMFKALTECHLLGSGI